MAPLLRDAGRGMDKELRQAVEVALAEKQKPILLVLEDVLAEGGRKRCEPLRDGREPGLRPGGEAGAGSREIEMVAVENPLLFGREAERSLARFQSVDAAKEGVVEIGLAPMAGERRRDLALDRLEFVVGLRAGQVEEDARDPVEIASAALERLDRVREGRRCAAPRDGVDLGARFFQRDVEGRAEMSGLDPVEGRRLEGSGPGREQGIGVGGVRHVLNACRVRSLPYKMIFAQS